jgi:hypothetical protein
MGYARRRGQANARPCEDLRACIAYALTSDGRLAKVQSAELMASIVAERLIARLVREGFVVMRRPPAPGASALTRGRGNRAPSPGARDADSGSFLAAVTLCQAADRPIEP